jgi:hypothetical protein
LIDAYHAARLAMSSSVSILATTPITGSCRSLFRGTVAVFVTHYLVLISGYFVSLFSKRTQNYLGFRDTLKRNTHSVYFLYSG